VPFQSFVYFIYFYPQFHPIQLVVTVLSHCCNYHLEGQEPPKHNPANPHFFLTQCSLNPEASCTNVSEEHRTPCQCACTLPATGVARARWDTAGQTLPIPDDAGPIVRGLSRVAASCDTASYRTRICSNAARTSMQCLRPLRDTGGLIPIICAALKKILPKSPVL
jgi:hypothetical protein